MANQNAILMVAMIAVYVDYDVYADRYHSNQTKGFTTRSPSPYFPSIHPTIFVDIFFHYRHYPFNFRFGFHHHQHR